MDAVRVDRWLSAARIYKSRTQATDACAGGQVRVNDERAKPNRLVRVGDEVRAQTARIERVLGVEKLAERRLSPPLARELYEDRTPEPEPRDGARRDRDDAETARTGRRPTKRDRRALDRFRRR